MPSSSALTPWYLHLAASKGHRNIVELLVRAGADVNACSVDIDSSLRNGITPLLAAAYGGHLPIIDFLMSEGASIDKAGSGGIAPLHVAACRGDVALVDLLLQAGAKPDNYSTSEGKTPLILAIEHASSTKSSAVEVVRLLLKAGANPEKSARIRSFSPFTSQDHFHQRMLHNPSLPRPRAVAPSVSGRVLTPLDRANELGHAEIVSLLVTACAARERNSLALLIAAKEGDAQTILTLLQWGADIEKSTADGETALFLAAQNGRVNAVCALLEAGANKNKAASNGSTPLYSAAMNGYARVVYQLIKAGANRDTPASNGKTPLFMAARHGHTEVVELLMNAGASL